jgi:hypothetical protein
MGAPSHKTIATPTSRRSHGLTVSKLANKSSQGYNWVASYYNP